MLCSERGSIERRMPWLPRPSSVTPASLSTAAANVTFTDPNAGSLPAAMAELLVNWQRLDGGRAGSIDDVSDFYRREREGRGVSR
jgi:hypothetical protein